MELITREQITKFGRNIVDKGREIFDGTSDTYLVQMNNLMPNDVDEDFKEMIDDRFIMFEEKGTHAHTCAYFKDIRKYLNSPLTSVVLGPYFKDVELDDDDAFIIGDVILNGIEREEIQKEYIFSYEYEKDEMEL